MANYSLTVYYGSGGKRSSVPGAPAGRTSTGAGGSSKSNLKQVAQVLGASSMIGFAKRVAVSAIQFQVNTVELRTGSQALQERYTMWQNNVARVWNAGTGLLLGVMTGNPLLAVGSLATSAAFAGIEYMQRVEKVRLEQSVENVSIGLSNIRAGVGGARLGRDVS